MYDAGPGGAIRRGTLIGGAARYWVQRGMVPEAVPYILSVCLGSRPESRGYLEWSRESRKKKKEDARGKSGGRKKNQMK